MNPGRGMDIFVAETVFEIPRESAFQAPHYSTSDAMALEVMEMLTKSPMGWSFTIHYRGPTDIDIYASAGDCNCPHDKDYDPKDKHGYSLEQVECEKVESLAHAICLVALRCVKAIPRAHCILCSAECSCTSQECGRDCKKCIPVCKERTPKT